MPKQIFQRPTPIRHDNWKRGGPAVPGRQQGQKPVLPRPDTQSAKSGPFELKTDEKPK